MTISNPPAKSKGLALITVLLIFAIVSVLATSMIERQSLDIQRSSNLQLLQQARAYGKGVEDAARVALRLDYDQGKDVDHLGEEFWALDRHFPLDENDAAKGSVHIFIQDAQGRFNLNNMAKGVANRADQIQRFRSLLSELGLDESIAQRAADFIDPDNQADDVYENLEPAYRSSQRPFKHRSELLLVDGVRMDVYRKLEPYIAALPSAATLNVNTASDYVLASLAPQLTLSDASQIISGRGTGKDGGFKTVDDFWSTSVIEPYTQGQTNQGGNNANEGNQGIKPWDKADFSVKSEYFEVFAEVEFYGQSATIEFLLYRNGEDGSFRTYYRDYSRKRVNKPVQAAGDSGQPGQAGANNSVSGSVPL